MRQILTLVLLVTCSRSFAGPCAKLNADFDQAVEQLRTYETQLTYDYERQLTATRSALETCRSCRGAMSLGGAGLTAMGVGAYLIALNPRSWANVINAATLALGTYDLYVASVEGTLIPLRLDPTLKWKGKVLVPNISVLVRHPEWREANGRSALEQVRTYPDRSQQAHQLEIDRASSAPVRRPSDQVTVRAFLAGLSVMKGELSALRHQIAKMDRLCGPAK